MKHTAMVALFLIYLTAVKIWIFTSIEPKYRGRGKILFDHLRKFVEECRRKEKSEQEVVRCLTRDEKQATAEKEE